MKTYQVNITLKNDHKIAIRVRALNGREACNLAKHKHPDAYTFCARQVYDTGRIV